MRPARLSHDLSNGRPMRVRGVAALAPIALLAVAACGGGDKQTGPTGPGPLATLSIGEAKLDTLSELASRQLTLAGADAKGQPIAGVTASWTSSDSAIAAVTAGGVVMARRPGNAVVSAQSGAVRTSLALRIVPVPIGDLTVRLVDGVSADTMLVGSTVGVVTEARDFIGSLLLGRTITVGVSDTSRGTIDANGRITGRREGSLELVLRSDTVARRRSVIVRPPFAAGLAIRLADPKKLHDTLWVGLRDSVVATFSDAAGQSLAPTSLRPLSYSSSDDKIATVDVYGHVAPFAPGTVTLRATGDKLAAARSVTVVAAPLASVVSATDTVRLAPGDSAQLRPVPIDGAGLSVRTLTSAQAPRYAMVDGSVAVVDAQGWVRGVRAGAAQVRVTVGAVSTTIPVKVSTPDPGRAFKIDLRFVGPTPSPAVAAAFDSAVAKWQRVIRETIGTEDSVTVPTSCYVKDPTLLTNVRDVVIIAVVDSIDGPSNILGGASPCIIKQVDSGRWLPLIGRMKFDSADLSNLVKNNTLTTVITHEIGHVLGIGTLWTASLSGGTALARQSGFDPRYFGPGGVSASAGAGYTFSTAGLDGKATLDAVPLENTGGGGTAYAHWRESVYGNELMTGYINSSVYNPMSLITVQAIADMGYSVATSSAEAFGRYFDTPAVPASAILGFSATRIAETISGPDWKIDRRGRLTRIPSSATQPKQ